MIEKARRVNIGVGLLLVSLVSLPTLFTLIGNHRNASFIPGNHWLWWAFLVVLAFGYMLSVTALLSRIPWGYSVWFQTAISFMVLIAYIGWWKRETNFIQRPHDPESSPVPPEAMWSAYLVILLITLAVGLLPLAIKFGIRRIRAKHQQHVSGNGCE